MVRTIRLFGLLIVGAVAAAFRLWHIGELPPGFHLDEAFEGLEAWRILTDPAYRPLFLTGNFGVPPLNAYANAVTFALFEGLGSGAGPTAMRVTAAAFGILGVFGVYMLADEMRMFQEMEDTGNGRPRRLIAGFSLSVVFPLWVAAVLATMRWHIHFSRIGIEPVMVPLVWAGATALLLRGWRTGSWIAFAACGSVAGLGMYSYQGAWIVPILLALTAVHLTWTGKSRLNAPAGTDMKIDVRTIPEHRRIYGLVLAGLLAALVFAPLAMVFALHPEYLLTRPTQLAIVGETGSAADSTIGNALVATATMFGPFGAPGDLDPRRNLPGAPALNLWQALPFYLGLGLALWRIRRPIYALTITGLIGLLLPGVVSEYAPHFHRILGAAAPVALLCGVGLDWFGQQGARVIRGVAAPAHPLLPQLVVPVLLILAGAWTAGHEYFVRWARLPELYYAFDVGLWDVGRWTAAQDARIPIYETPRTGDHPTLAFAWRDPPTLRQNRTSDSPEFPPNAESATPAGTETGANANRPVTFDGRHIFPLALTPPPRDEFYVAIEHEDFRTPLLLPEVFPQANVAQEFTDYGGQTYAQVYVRPAGSVPARAPSVPITRTVGDGITIAGYDVLPETLQPGAVLYLQLHWDVMTPPVHDWTVYTHVLDRQTGVVVAGHDSRPGNGSLSTLAWQSGWRILDEYQIVLPADLPPGEYLLAAGLYRATDAGLVEAGEPIELGSVDIGDAS